MPIAGVAVYDGRVLVHADGLLISLCLSEGNAEAVQGAAFGVPVASLAADGGGVLAGGDGLVEPPCPAESFAQAA